MRPQLKVSRSAAMTALRVALLVVGTFSTGYSHAAPRDSRVLPLAASVETRVLDALGGARRLAALHALRATGTLEGLEGFPGTYEILAEAPDRRRETWDIGYLRDTTAVAGNQGWERTNHVRELAGEELSRDRRDARFGYPYRLIISHAPVSIALGHCGHEPAYLLTFRRPREPAETFGVNPKTYLPLCRARTEDYEEGQREVRTTFSDYREVGGLMLPFKITEERPENTLKITIAKYDLNPTIPVDAFRNPLTAHLSDPVEVNLSTSPAHIYKEPDGNYTTGPQRLWGTYFYQSESWSLDLVVRELYGRYVDPVYAHIDFYSGSQKVASQSWSAQALAQMRRYPTARFWPFGDLYGIRHNFSMPAALDIDRMVYTLVTRREGHSVTRSITIPVSFYRPRTKLIFPIKGRFIVTSGHQYYELEHKYERSQQFAIDIVPLGPSFEFASHDGAKVEDYWDYARAQIIAPAAGRVVYARNDIPDGALKAKFLKMKDALQAIAGNVVIIDHGHHEFSVFCHMHHGSVLVKTGDYVKQGQPIGLLGAAASPGLPHLHYQLQNGPQIFGADGLPLVFQNIYRVGWLGRYSAADQHGSASVESPRAGIYMEAR